MPRTPAPRPGRIPGTMPETPPRPAHATGSRSGRYRSGTTATPDAYFNGARRPSDTHRGSAQRVLVRRAEDTSLGDDGSDEPGGRDVEGSVHVGDTVRRDALGSDANDLVLGSFIDRDRS